jgi:hypothetical protein
VLAKSLGFPTDLEKPSPSRDHDFETVKISGNELDEITVVIQEIFSDDFSVASPTSFSTDNTIIFCGENVSDSYS